MKMRLTQDANLNNVSPQLVMTNVLHIASVTRLDADTNGQARSCMEIPEELAGQYEDVNSIYYTTKLDPKYYVANNTLSVLPEPTANQTAKVKHITPETNTALSESDVANFPPELNRGVILYAAGEVLRKFLSLKNATLVGLSMQDVVPPSSPSLDSIIYNGPGNADVGATHTYPGYPGLETLFPSPAPKVKPPPQPYAPMNQYTKTASTRGGPVAGA